MSQNFVVQGPNLSRSVAEQRRGTICYNSFHPAGRYLHGMSRVANSLHVLVADDHPASRKLLSTGPKYECTSGPPSAETMKARPGLLEA